MNELIVLNPTEQFLQDSNIMMTLKDVADYVRKEHKNVTRDFKKMIAELSDDEVGQLKFELSEYRDASGKLNPTFNMDLKTMLLVMTKYDHSLRLQVINLAFERLEESKKLAVTEAKKLNMNTKGECSVRRAISEIWTDDNVKAPSETDIWNSLVWRKFVVTTAKVTVARTIPIELNGYVGTMKARGDVKFLPETVETVWNEFVEAGRPVKSEYERLKEEFAEISKYYETKLAEAKGGN